MYVQEQLGKIPLLNGDSILFYYGAYCCKFSFVSRALIFARVGIRRDVSPSKMWAEGIAKISENIFRLIDQEEILK